MGSRSNRLRSLHKGEICTQRLTGTQTECRAKTGLMLPQAGSQKQDRGLGQTFPQGLRRLDGPDGTLILDFLPPEL